RKKLPNPSPHPEEPCAARRLAGSSPALKDRCVLSPNAAPDSAELRNRRVSILPSSPATSLSPDVQRRWHPCCDRNDRRRPVLPGGASRCSRRGNRGCARSLFPRRGVG